MILKHTEHPGCLSIIVFLALLFLVVAAISMILLGFCFILGTGIIFVLGFDCGIIIRTVLGMATIVAATWTVNKTRNKP